jgi:hypothetical protein
MRGGGSKYFVTLLMNDPLYASIYGKSDLPEVLFSLLQPLTSLISVKRDASLEMKGKQV